MRGCVYYTATPDYLFQTYVSASQAARHAPEGVTVVVFVFPAAGQSTPVGIFRELGRQAGVDVVHVETDTETTPLDPLYARYHVGPLLPDDCMQFLYLDGDTQVVRSLAPLFEHAVGTGCVSAVADPGVFIRASDRRLGRRIETRMLEAGIPRSRWDSYMNSGVLRFERSWLASIVEHVTETHSRRPSTTRFGDQDALNTSEPPPTALSLTWNFPGFLLRSPAQTEVAPSIVHFMSNPRPWDGPFFPFGRTSSGPYRALLEQVPELKKHVPVMTPRRRARYQVQQAVKVFVERPYYHRAAFLQSIKGYESRATASPLPEPR